MANAKQDPNSGKFVKSEPAVNEQAPATKASFLEPSPPTQDFIQTYNRQMSGLAPASVAQAETPKGDLSPIAPAMADDAIWKVLDRKRSQLRSLELELMKPARVTDAMGHYIGEMPHIKAQREVMAQEIARLKGEISELESMSSDERLRYVRERANIAVGRAGIQVIL